jgi:hypothetical protein
LRRTFFPLFYRMFFCTKKWVGAILLSACCATAMAQKKKVDFDSSYYETYPKLITGRVFFSGKYTHVNIQGNQGVRPLKYRPNGALNVGVGISYGPITLNASFPLSFINPDNDVKGKTRSLDLQTHIYTRKWVVDLLGQFYGGFYLRPKGYGNDDPLAFYQRPDIKVRKLGFSAFHVFNYDRFSHKAAFLQNEWQKKSAGTFLVGAEAYYGLVKADSSLVPESLFNFYPQQNIAKSSFFSLGPGGGYAYTYVFREHFFATASSTINTNINFVKERKEDGTTVSKTTFSPNLFFRTVVGYNNDKWSASLSWVANRITAPGVVSSRDYVFSTGNYRITFAKRFPPKGLLKKRIREVEDRF